MLKSLGKSQNLSDQHGTRAHNVRAKRTINTPPLLSAPSRRDAAISRHKEASEARRGQLCRVLSQPCCPWRSRTCKKRGSFASGVFSFSALHSLTHGELTSAEREGKWSNNPKSRQEIVAHFCVGNFRNLLWKLLRMTCEHESLTMKNLKPSFSSALSFMVHLLK